MRGDPFPDWAIAIIDGETGRLKKRVFIPRNRSYSAEITSQSFAHECNTLPVEFLASIHNIMVGEDGRAYFVYQDRQIEARSDFTSQCTSTFLKQDTKLKMMVLNGNGLVVEYVTASHTTYGCGDVPFPYQLIGDGSGGVLASSVTQQNCGPAPELPHQVARVDSSGNISIFPYPEGYGLSMASDGNVYLGAGNSAAIVAKDVATWTTKWTAPATGEPILAVDGGGFVLKQGTVIKADGTIQTALSIPMNLPSSVAKLGHWISPEWDSALGAGVVRAWRGIDVPPSNNSFAYGSTLPVGRPPGNPWNQWQPYMSCEDDAPDLEISWKGWSMSIVKYKFSDATEWTDARKAAVIDAFEAWNKANLQTGLNVQFQNDQSVAEPALFLSTLPTAVYKSKEAQAWFIAEDDDVNVDGEIIKARIDIAFKDFFQGELTPEGYRKAALHEIGHSLGLFHNEGRDFPLHPHGINGSSVMNNFSGPSDSLGYIPGSITRCDRQRAKESADRQPH